MENWLLKSIAFCVFIGLVRCQMSNQQMNAAAALQDTLGASMNSPTTVFGTQTLGTAADVAFSSPFGSSSAADVAFSSPFGSIADQSASSLGSTLNSAGNLQFSSAVSGVPYTGAATPQYYTGGIEGGVGQVAYGGSGDPLGGAAQYASPAVAQTSQYYTAQSSTPTWYDSSTANAQLTGQTGQYSNSFIPQYNAALSAAGQYSTGASNAYSRALQAAQYSASLNPSYGLNAASSGGMINPTYYNTAIGASGVNANFYNNLANLQSQRSRVNVVQQPGSRYHVHTEREYIPVHSVQYRDRIVPRAVAVQGPTQVQYRDRYVPVSVPSPSRVQYRDRLVVQPVASQDRKRLNVLDQRRVSVILPPQQITAYTPQPRQQPIIYRQQLPQVQYVQQRYAYHGYNPGQSTYQIGNQGGIGSGYGNILGIAAPVAISLLVALYLAFRAANP